MKDIAVDVGSGVTKVCTSSVRTSFASLTGVPESEESEFEKLGGSIVSFKGKSFATGEKARTLVSPGNLEKSTEDGWFKSDGYLALLYAAIAEALPGGFSGKIRLCTGLPQALYQDNRKALQSRLVAKHSFRVNEQKYSVTIRSDDIQIMPQVMGLFLSRVALDASLQKGKVALIDVGTYTSDWTVVENLKMLHWASGGAAIGVATIKEHIHRFLKANCGHTSTDADLTGALIKKSILVQGRQINLTAQINAAALTCVERIVNEHPEFWDQASGAKMIVGGGGGEYFARAIQMTSPHAVLIPDPAPIYSIVDGYFVFMEQRRQRMAAA